MATVPVKSQASWPGGTGTSRRSVRMVWKSIVGSVTSLPPTTTHGIMQPRLTSFYYSHSVRSRHAFIERCGIKPRAVAVLDVAHSIDGMDTYAVYICQWFCKRWFPMSIFWQLFKDGGAEIEWQIYSMNIKFGYRPSEGNGSPSTVLQMRPKIG